MAFHAFTDLENRLHSTSNAEDHDQKRGVAQLGTRASFATKRINSYVVKRPPPPGHQGPLHGPVVPNRWQNAHISDQAENTNQRRALAAKVAELDQRVQAAALAQSSSTNNANTNDMMVDEPFAFNVSTPRRSAGWTENYVEDYQDTIMNHMYEVESKYGVCPSYMDLTQTEVKPHMRGAVFNWLVPIHSAKKMQNETLHLACNYFDRFLAARQVPLKMVQLVGVTSLWLASKYEETIPPIARDLVFCGPSDAAYTEDDILQFERTMLVVLEFRCTVPTSHFFLVKALAENPNKQLRSIAMYFAELALLEYNMLEYPPSLIAAACHKLATTVVGETWVDVLRIGCRFPASVLHSCIQTLWDLGHTAGAGTSKNLRAVHDKYSRTAQNHATRAVAEILHRQLAKRAAQLSPRHSHSVNCQFGSSKASQMMRFNARPASPSFSSSAETSPKTEGGRPHTIAQVDIVDDAPRAVPAASSSGQSFALIRAPSGVYHHIESDP